MSARSEVSDSVVDRIRAALACDGALPGGWRAKILPTPEGGHVYDLAHDGEVISRCWLCLDDAVAESMWASASAAPTLPGVILRQPAQTPWLAAALTLSPPLLAQPAMIADVLIEAGDLERCVAWALIE